jgi:hypothetical protein
MSDFLDRWNVAAPWMANLVSDQARLLHAERARQRTYDALLRKARAGHVTGGRLFGYDNVEVFATGGRRSHVERRTNESEAAAIRRVFELCAEGRGLTSIAKALNADRLHSPRPQRGRPRAWALWSVREVLYRTVYRGEFTWNRSRKRNPWGQVQQRGSLAG